MQYISSPFFQINIGIGQGSALSPIPSALYFSLLFYIFEKHVKNLKIPVFFFVIHRQWSPYFSKIF